MLSINPNDISIAHLQNYLQGAVAPRPIAFASTIDKKGNPNLSPFSFFNVFSANPPIMVFSPARRVRNNTIKHTLINVEKTKEVVINVVNYDIVQQMSLSSTEYPEEINEFDKSGLTMLASDYVKPFRVAESPVQFECKVNDIISMGNNGGAGNLVICEVVKIHIKKEILDGDGKIDQSKIDLVSRMGGNWYSRAKLGLFEVEKPLTTLGIGVDALPSYVKGTTVFSGNDLGKLGNIEKKPTKETIDLFVKDNEIELSLLSRDKQLKLAKEFLDKGEVLNAWKVLLLNNI